MLLLTNDTISYIESNLGSFREEFIDLYFEMTTIVKSFEKNDVVRSLYESGKFGHQEREKLEKIKNGFKKYYDMLAENDGLISRTNQFLEEQRQLNNMKGGN